MVFWEPSRTPWCPRAGAEGVWELLGAPRGASRIHLRPRSHFRGPLGTRFEVLRSRLRTKFGPEESFADKSCRVRGRVRVLLP